MPRTQIAEGDIKDDAVTTDQILDGSVTSDKLASGLTTITGEIRMYAISGAPSGWLECDGSEVSQTTYATLFAAIGANAFGTDSGGNFFLPDFRGRIPVGVGTGDATNATAFALADKDGDEIHELTSAENGPHTHTSDIFGSGVLGFAGGGVNSGTRSSIASDSSGSGTGHNNLQPSLGITFIIKI